MTEASNLYKLEPCCTVEGCEHVLDLTGRETTRPEGVDLADILWGILTAPFDAALISDEAWAAALAETA